MVAVYERYLAILCFFAFLFVKCLKEKKKIKIKKIEMWGYL